MVLFEKYGIDVSKIIGGKTFCPKCGHTRKNKRDRSLSVDIRTGLFNCHNAGCDFRGCALQVVKEKKEYVKPVKRLETLSKKSIDWFESRGISNNTIIRFGITESKEWIGQFNQNVTCICFNYFRSGELVNIKFRGPQKSFKLSKDSELIFYNLDSIDQEEEVFIVEGEIDCLSLHECGIYRVVSVPNGASMGNQKLEYLDNCYTSFEKLKRIVLATDSDSAGMALRDELARRLGKERCFTVEYPEGCKDINDVLMKYGKEEVLKVAANKKEWPIEGIITMDEMFETIIQWYEKGYPPGAKSGIDGLDNLITFAPKQLTVITGIPGHGKDEFFNLLAARLAEREGWRFGICGFEEEAEQTVTKLIEKYIGKSFDFRNDATKRITTQDFESGVRFVDKYFYFYKTEAIETDIESLLAIADVLVVKYGIRGLCINPWNWVDNTHDGMSETEYVSWALGKIIRFARKRDVHVFLIAHTTKIEKDKVTKKFSVPNLYSISGSAHFYNKAHNGITIYRDQTTDVYVQKIKQSWLGQKGFSTYKFDPITRQYQFIECSVDKRPGDFARPVVPDNLIPFAEAEAKQKKQWEEASVGEDLPF